jgi:hypothetical protein
MYLGDAATKGPHAERTNHILRLRVENNLKYNAREWSLLRLSHHRVVSKLFYILISKTKHVNKQKQQLGFKQDPMSESKAWLDSLDEELPEIQIEKQSFEIAEICKKARRTLEQLNDAELRADGISTLIKEMHELDQKTPTWRKEAHWSFTSISSSKIAPKAALSDYFPDTVQVHRDIWIAYEWNYHRTARIILHEQLLQCIDRVFPGTTEDTRMEFEFLREVSISIIRVLVDEILSTVPQSLGDIDDDGNLLDPTVPRKCRGVAAYFLLWPMKITKRTKSATPKQRETAQYVFDRVREYTGMKSLIGELSCI